MLLVLVLLLSVLITYPGRSIEHQRWRPQQVLYGLGMQKNRVRVAVESGRVELRRRVELCRRVQVCGVQIRRVGMEFLFFSPRRRP